MKNFLPTLILFFSCLSACNSALDKDTVAEVITTELGYPRPLPFEIITTDPVFINSVKNTSLVADQWVSIENVDMLLGSTTIIRFNEKSQPFLLKRTPQDQQLHIQKVKLADEEFGEVISIEKISGEVYKVKYTTRLSGITPFALLLTSNLKSKVTTNTVKLIKERNSWVINK